MYMQIADNKKAKNVQINIADDLKLKLKGFGIRHSLDTSKDPLTRNELEAIKTLRSDETIIVQRPDKSGGVV